MFSLELFGVWLAGWLCGCDPLGWFGVVGGTLRLVCFNSVGVVSSLWSGFDVVCAVIA